MAIPGRVEHAAAEVPERLHRLVTRRFPGARIVAVQALGADVESGSVTTKGVGYGVPLRIDVEIAGERRSLVLHTATANAFGHDRRADRAAEAILASDTFGAIPRHVPVLDVGAFRAEDDAVSLRDTGEFYLLTAWGNGEPYAQSLRRIAETSTVQEADLQRVDHLADYLVSLHAERLSLPFAQERAFRDLFGSGEGIFGIVDGYAGGAPGAAPARLRSIEQLCLAWRWRLKRAERPLVRTHGDFHPFNVLFDAKNELVLLDTSRGSAGDAADDVTCMALNYPFFALQHEGAWQRAFSQLWQRFWIRYLRKSGDLGVLDVAPPFLAWRGLVLASPVWYPELSASSRGKILDFVEAALRMDSFAPDLVEQMFR